MDFSHEQAGSECRILFGFTLFAFGFGFGLETPRDLLSRFEADFLLLSKGDATCKIP